MTPQLDIPCMSYPLMSGVYERFTNTFRYRCSLRYNLCTVQADFLFFFTLTIIPVNIPDSTAYSTDSHLTPSPSILHESRRGRERSVRGAIS
jgi:hypothetical protein